MWEYTVELDRALMTSHDAEKTRFACRITKTRIHTHTIRAHNIEYLLLFHGSNGLRTRLIVNIVRTLLALLTLKYVCKVCTYSLTDVFIFLLLLKDELCHLLMCYLRFVRRPPCVEHTS